MLAQTLTTQAGSREWLMLKLINQRLNLNCLHRPSTIIARLYLAGLPSTVLALRFCTVEAVLTAVIFVRERATATRTYLNQALAQGVTLTRGGTRFN